jgi:hypothetical protein
VSVRRFNGVNDVIKVSLGSCDWTFGTLAVLIRRNENASFDAFISNHTSAAVRQPTLEINSANKMFLTGAWSVDHPGATEILTANGWYILVITKATGTVAPRLHIYRVNTGTWVHENEPGTETNPPSQAGGAIWFGATSAAGNFANADFAAAAEWPGKVLSDAECEALATATSLKAGWKALSPSGLWTFDQASVETSVEDLTGNGANQTARTGTTVIAEEPPIPYVAPASLGMVI